MRGRVGLIVFSVFSVVMLLAVLGRISYEVSECGALAGSEFHQGCLEQIRGTSILNTPVLVGIWVAGVVVVLASRSLRQSKRPPAESPRVPV